MVKPVQKNEVALSAVKPALKNSARAEFIIRDAIMALPEGEARDAAGGEREVGSPEGSRSVAWYVNKDFLAQLVLDGVIETHGMGAGYHVGNLIAEAGLASKYPRGRNNY